MPDLKRKYTGVLMEKPLDQTSKRSLKGSYDSCKIKLDERLSVSVFLKGTNDSSSGFHLSVEK